MHRSQITISRAWNNPSISVQVTHLDISLKMDMDDFLKALVEEMGNPTLLLTKAQLAQKLEKAAGTVIETVKQESIKVV